MPFQLPASEDELWHQVVVRLLAQRDRLESEAGDQLRLLEELAFHSRFCGRQLTQEFVQKTATWLADDMGFGSPADTARGWLADLESWDLLVRNGSGAGAWYEFPIQTLDEYFAARHLAARWEDKDLRYSAWFAHVARGPGDGGMRCPNDHCHADLPPFSHYLWRSEWHDIILLFAGILPNATALLQRIEREADDVLRRVLVLEWTCAGRAKAVESTFEQELTARVLRERCPYLMASPSFDYMSQSLGAPYGSDWHARFWDEAATHSRQPKITRLKAFGDSTTRGDQRVSALIASLNDSDPAVRRDAAAYLGDIGDSSAVTALAKALRDDNQLVRCSAAEALERIGDASSVPALVEAAAECEHYTRVRVVRALGKVGDVSAVPALLDLRKQLRLREFAERALCVISERNNVRIFEDGTFEPLP